ncbi:fructose bisphosphate aldolase [Brevibacterium samyangense]|uniref:fructose-bisphosphate aldolase n=1 Tax=Brevibacterium samyangense TaxID=366888 RepID=A0ABN2T3X8_9MICO
MKHGSDSARVDDMFTRVRSGAGFIAALDQSGGSTPQALRLYGISEDSYSSPAEMFDLVHRMRTRVITSPAFNGDRILGSILFEDTMDREIDGRQTGEYLWEVKGIVPFLKIDKGLAAQAHGAQVMKPIPELDALLIRAVSRHMFGTKMRSVITMPGPGLDAVVAQQFAIARQVLRFGLVPIVEPEVDIHSPDKAGAEDQLRTAIREELDGLGEDQPVILKLTLPERDDHYREFVDHPRVVRVLALSGGYSRADANTRLARNHGMIASFSRALTEGLAADQTDAQFTAALDAAIASIVAASRT